jgi:hypothetical protein
VHFSFVVLLFHDYSLSRSLDEGSLLVGLFASVLFISYLFMEFVMQVPHHKH